MWNRFRDDAKTAMHDAKTAVAQLGHDAIDTQHLLLGLCSTTDSVACRLLAELGASCDDVRDAIDWSTKRGRADPTTALPYTPGSKRALEGAMQVAVELGHDYIGTGHLLLGILADGKGRGARTLHALGVDPFALRGVIECWTTDSGAES